MRWEAIVVIAVVVIGALATVLTIGEHKKPTTPANAVTVIVLDAFLVYLILRLIS